MPYTPETLTAAGWQTQDTLQGFSSHVSPFWHRDTGDLFCVGFFVEPAHCNEHLGTAHGGALLTFADIVGGWAVSRALGHYRCATIQLQSQFTAAARAGDFVWCEPEIVRQTRDVIFMRSKMVTDDRTVMSFDGIWKVLAERG